MHYSSQRDLLDQESLLAASCPIVGVSQKVATSIGKLYYVQRTILLWRTSIAPASHLNTTLKSKFSNCQAQGHLSPHVQCQMSFEGYLKGSLRLSLRVLRGILKGDFKGNFKGDFKGDLGA